ncbi:ATP-grasp domain-containing protein [Streptomyces sp. SID3343]|uniref:ATP-grasp domain-containing protein n=1 Tax=Streptomyces sp. SID3343 TaxID=2690260 RepID=UPI0013689F1B|nr:ATP-grasp domain-containing protein [Streptomyces sp. SID3343]MYW01133.1 ATP-grasp domain-containing protein [Streptomyces sp. SID3343]
MTSPCIAFFNLRTHQLAYLPTLRAASRLGYEVLLITDRPPDDLPRGLVREVSITDTYDVAAVLKTGGELAHRHDIVGVVPWRDRDVVPAAALADRLGLPGTPLPAAAITRNKYLMRESLRDRSSLLPRFALVRTWREAAAAAADIGYPAVLKPTVSMGSMGVFQVCSEQELEHAHRTLSAYAQSAVHPVFASAPGELIYEEYLEGSEHSVEGYVHDGRVIVVGITDKTTSPPFHLEIRHVFPTSLGSREQYRVRALVSEVIRVCGLDNCAFHLECKVDRDRIRLIEVAARVGGDYITSHLVPLATKEPFYENVLRLSVGSRPLTPATGIGAPSMFAGVVKIIAEHEGRFGGFRGIERALAVPGVEHVTVERSLGDNVLLPPRDYTGCVLAAVIACSHSAAEVDARLDQAARTLTPRWAE